MPRQPDRDYPAAMDPPIRRLVEQKPRRKGKGKQYASGVPGVQISLTETDESAMKRATDFL